MGPRGANHAASNASSLAASERPSIHENPQRSYVSLFPGIRIGHVSRAPPTQCV